MQQLYFCFKLLYFFIYFATYTTKFGNAQVVNLTIFTESQCKYCTSFLQKHVWPLYSEQPELMNIQIIPFGKGTCKLTNNNLLHCKCMHGPTECDLNRLQNCVIYNYPKQYLQLLTCVQGLANLNEAYEKCIKPLPKRTQNLLMNCATTQTGERLNYIAMINTQKAGVELWPTAYVNGQFFNRKYPLRSEICRHTNCPPI